MHHLFLLLCFLPSFLIALNAMLDLEEASQEFVLGVKKIEIPGHPLAFNPSIIRWRGLLLMSFRIIPDRKNSFTSILGVVLLDEDFNPISEPQLLNTQLSPTTPSRTDDGRLITVGDQIFLVYSDNTEPVISRGGFRVYVAELRFDGMGFSVVNPDCLMNFEGERKDRREKNWVPFVYHDQMLLAYSIQPHVIFHPLLGTGTCETLYSSDTKTDWKWGDLRGGTTGLKMGDEYLSFFHSSIDIQTLHSDGKSVSHYVMGAYTFATEPPFAITKISPYPIVGKGFYRGPIYKPYWKSIRCVYPGGFIFDDNYIWVVYGRQDHEAWVVKLDRQGLMNNLIRLAPH